jgi:hypothetical protein
MCLLSEKAVAVPENTLTKPTLMLVGTGHWSNPGKDYRSVEFDEMLSPERQRQIASCLERFVGFAPTRVAVEVMASAHDALNADYQRYRRGEMALTANERHQLGFRLAAMMNHDQIQAIDWHDMERAIGWDTAIEFARQHNQPEFISFFNELSEEGPEERATEAARIRGLSVREQLLETNDPANISDSHHLYMDLAQVGEGTNYIGADVVLRWYERNIKIFVNIARLVKSPDDRILVVIGGGHLPLLTHFATSSGRFDVVSALSFLK